MALVWFNYHSAFSSVIMSKAKQNEFEKTMPVYESKCFLVRNLYWNRIKTAIDFAQIRDDFALLDIGCNRGQLLKSIRNVNKHCELWGTDIEPGITTLKIDDCNFRVCDIKKLPFENGYFDIVFVLSTLEHIPDLDSAIKEISRVLKPQGSAILSSPTESWFYRFCRFLLFGDIEKDVHTTKSEPRSEADHHYHNVYGIEKKFFQNGFKQIKLKSHPRFPVPVLHRVSKFQKHNNE